MISKRNAFLGFIIITIATGSLFYSQMNPSSPEVIGEQRDDQDSFFTELTPQTNSTVLKTRVDECEKLEKDMYLDKNTKVERVFITSCLESSEEKTTIFINDKKNTLLLDGYFLDMKTYDMSKSGKRLVVISTEGGHSINTVPYEYQNGILSRIPVSTEKSPGFEGILSRNDPEFKDIDGDGKLEMLAYYRHFPPKPQRTVEVYTFTGESFQKIDEYEEKMAEDYL